MTIGTWSVYKKKAKDISRRLRALDQDGGDKSAQTPSYGEQKSNDISVSRAESSYLVLLEGILNSLESIQHAGNLVEPPQIAQAASEIREPFSVVWMATPSS